MILTTGYPVLSVWNESGLVDIEPIGSKTSKHAAAGLHATTPE